MWSVHRDHKKLDRAGQASGQDFRCIPHDTLVDHVSFDLTRNNYCSAAGSVWVRRGCITMGGPFSSQSADLHCVWGAYSNRNMFGDLGQLIISDSGYPYWVGEWTIALCQFRDNILMAIDASKKAVYSCWLHDGLNTPCWTNHRGFQSMRPTVALSLCPTVNRSRIGRHIGRYDLVLCIV